VGEPAAVAVAAKAGVRPSRRLARQLVLQSLYRQQLNPTSSEDLLRELPLLDDAAAADLPYAEALLHATLDQEPDCVEAVRPFLERAWESLDPIERGILWLGACELRTFADVPYRVVLNEAIELGKRFGATEGHRFVNGVLDRLAQVLRADEVAQAARRPPRPPRQGRGG